MGNMEYFEVCEITPNTMPQLYDALAKMYCILHMRNMLTTFRQSSKTQQWPLRCSVDSQLRHQKGPSHGARHGNTERQRIYHAAHVSSTKAEKMGFTSILDRFWKCPIYRRSQMDIGWTEDHCARLDEIAAGDHSHIDTAAERARRENTWVLVLKSSSPNSLMIQR